MTTLVTGGAGFIGYHVARKLLEGGRSVVAIDNLNGYYDARLKKARVDELLRTSASSFRFIELDFTDQAHLERAFADVQLDVILHLGAQPGVRYSLENPSAYFRSNLLGHGNVLELARGRQVRHLLYASSSSVYGAGSKLPFSTSDRTDYPVSLYAATKKADELMSEAYAHLYRIPMTGLRFFTVYGPWGRPDMAVWSFTEKILSGRPVEVFNEGKMRRDFTYIDDIVAGVLLCLDNPPLDNGERKAGGSRGPHRIYNLGNHRSEELMRLISIIEAACGRKAEIELGPMQPGDVQDTYADISDIQTELGYMPVIPIDVGVPRFVDWYRSYSRA